MTMALIIFCSVMLLAGCDRPAKQKTSAAAPKKKSTMQTAIDGATGRTAVRAGRRAQDTLREVSADKKEDLDEVLGK